MVGIAIYIRLRLQETPIFQAIKAKGQTAVNPWREAFLGPNLKYVVIATIVVLGEGCVWYSSQFRALYFLQTVKQVDVLTSSVIVGAALVYPIAVPAVAFVLAFFLMPETRKISIWAPEEVPAARTG